MAHHFQLESFDPPPAVPVETATAPEEPDRPDPEPAPPAEPEADETVVPDERIEQALTRLVAGIERLDATVPELRASARREAAWICADIAAGAIPHLAAAGFPSALAEVFAAGLRGGRCETLVLRLNEADRDAVFEALAARDRPALETLTFEIDPDLEPGGARLVWEDGGADLDRDAITAAALTQLEKALAGPAFTQETET